MKFGDVILFEDKHYVNLGISKNYEDIGSCSYDRTYRLFSIDSNVEKIVGSEVDVRQVHVRETYLPFKKTDWIPYNVYESVTRTTRNESLISEETEFTLEQKKPTLVYE
ncbi:hypothetical protein [Bacillus atrophaeus]|uniref:hypothetical protein n=1 Tax=Bacillus atrophaeus TaxID=1452 RepID=UPI002E1B600B|nr:hypothetical protein [Bacillus atrophaeus]